MATRAPARTSADVWLATPVRPIVPLVDGQRFTAISVGSEYTCALSAAGAAYCWGEPSDGALGSGP